MTSESIDLVSLAAPPDAVVAVPGSKSHTNRALICAGLANGTSTLEGVLVANDTMAMMGALGALGVDVELDEKTSSAVVRGTAGMLQPGPLALDVNQSGTTSRFILALLPLGSGDYTLDGHTQLRARPFEPLASGLRALGATIDADHLPVVVAADGLRSGTVELSGSISSQYLSGLLLAGPYATGESGRMEGLTVDLTDKLISRPYVDLTASTMDSFGVEVVNHDYERFVVSPGPYEGATLSIEPDASAASYFFAAAAVTGGRVRVDGLGVNTVQGDLAFVETLAQMGAKVTIGDNFTEVIGPDELHGVTVDMADISDTAQTLAIVATFANSPTVVTGIGFIAAKEIDRVSAVVTELNKLGIDATKDSDGWTIRPGTPKPGVVEPYDDHRMAMSFALLGLVHPGLSISNPGCVAKTFPDYFTRLNQLR